LEIGRSHGVPNQGSTVGGGWQPFCFSPESAGWGRKCETGRCHGKAAGSVLAKVRGDVFAHFHAVAAKRRSRTRNSQFGLWDRCFTLPQLLNWWRHQPGIFWSPEYFGYHLVVKQLESGIVQIASNKKKTVYSLSNNSYFLKNRRKINLHKVREQKRLLKILYIFNT
jgi:hypothetical protein